MPKPETILKCYAPVHDRKQAKIVFGPIQQKKKEKKKKTSPAVSVRSA